MKLEWTVKHEANIDLDEVYTSFCEFRKWADNETEDSIMDDINTAIWDNLVFCDPDDKDIPDELYQNIVDNMLLRIGGIQMCMFGKYEYMN